MKIGNLIRYKHAYRTAKDVYLIIAEKECTFYRTARWELLNADGELTFTLKANELSWEVLS